MTDLNHVHFGHGKFACPGRQLALTDVKMTAAALLLNFDMRFKEGGKRPRNVAVHEMVFPEPGAVVEFRRRGVGSPGNRIL
jgi:cytochrome P450